MTSPLPHADVLIPKLRAAERLDLYLDYDGTLAPFAPTPDDVLPDPRLIDLVSQLARQPKLRLPIISSRRLARVRELLAILGLLLAGTYGVEMLTPDGKELHRIPHEAIRPTLDTLKPRWESLIAGKDGFYLEDKGWALAIHARNAEEKEALHVLDAAEKMLTPNVLGGHLQKIFSYRFIEIGPKVADKGQCLSYLFEQFPWPNSIPIYLGDDDKDEEAFHVIKSKAGFPIVVTQTPQKTLAEYRLDSPADVHRWLKQIFL